MPTNQRPPLQTEDLGDRGDWHVSRVHSGSLDDMYQFLDGVGPGTRVWVVAHGTITESEGFQGDGYITLIGSTDNSERDKDWFREHVEFEYNKFDRALWFDVHWRALPRKRR